MQESVREKYERKAKAREWVVLAMVGKVVECMNSNYEKKKD